MRALAVQLVGDRHVVDLDIRMGAEDFAYYTHVMPGCFFRLGTGNAEKPGTQGGLHTPGFDIDEDAMATGAAMMALGALSELD
jgi:hippurate hydrolase